MAFPFLGALGSALFGSAAATSATITAGASLAGGLLSDRANRKAQERQNAFNLAQNDPSRIRAQAEEAGIHVSQLLGNWSPVQQGSFAPSVMGTAVAEAGAAFGNYFDNKAKEQSALTKAQQQNQELRKRLTDLTLRPKVGGIFGGGDKPLSGGSASGGTYKLPGAFERNPIARLAFQGEGKPERAPMEDKSFWATYRGLGVPIIAPAEPDLDESMTVLAYAAPQILRENERQKTFDTIDYIGGTDDDRSRIRSKYALQLPWLSAAGLGMAGARIVNSVTPEDIQSRWEENRKKKREPLPPPPNIRGRGFGGASDYLGNFYQSIRR